MNATPSADVVSFVNFKKAALRGAGIVALLGWFAFTK